MIVLLASGLPVAGQQTADRGPGLGEEKRITWVSFRVSLLEND